MVPATDHACSTRPSVRTLSTGLQNPTDLRQMPKSNASIAPWPKNALTRQPITVTKPAPRHMLTGCTTIITTYPTPASEVSHPQTAFTTSRGITLKRDVRRLKEPATMTLLQLYSEIPIGL